MAVTYQWRGAFTNAEVNALHAEAFETRVFDESEWNWAELVHRHSLRSEEHTSELQSLRHLVCRLLLEKKKPPLSSLNPCRPPIPGATFSQSLFGTECLPGPSEWLCRANHATSSIGNTRWTYLIASPVV